MPAMPKQTTAVTVTLTLDSSISAPTYNVASCLTLVTYSDNSTSTLPGWGNAALATPQPNGATFNLVLLDSNLSAPMTAILNWALTCIPRATTPPSGASPFGNNISSIGGSGSTPGNGGGLALNFGNTNNPSNNNPKIKNVCTWDWSLMVQVVCADGATVKCFGSDPEMEVGG